MAGKELINGDKILELNNNGLLTLGRVIKSEQSERNLRSSKKLISSSKVLWEGCRENKEMKADKPNQVYDRNFFIGQDVRYGLSTARVLASHELVIVQLYNKDKHILESPVHVDDLTPVKKLFVGVHVELNGWVGVIIRVERNLRVAFKKKDLYKPSQCFIKTIEPQIFRIKYRQKKRPRKRLNRSYPFKDFNFLSRKSSFVPFKGKYINFNMGEIKNHANWIGRNPFNYISRNERKKRYKGRVLYSKNHCAIVKWITPIPSVSSSEEIPPEKLTKKHIRRLRFFHINPSRYVNAGGICNLQIASDATTVSQKDFSQHYWNLLRGNLEERKTKLEKIREIKRNMRTVAVVKYLSFHMYSIQISEANKVELVNGKDLITIPTPSENCVPKTQFPGIYYVIKNDELEGSNEYGVALNMEMDNEEIMCQVQWFQIVGNKSQELGILNENRKNLVIHNKFNELRPGAIVYNSKIPNNIGFYFGNVCSVDRYNFGKVIVYCAVGKVKKQLWPHQLEVLKLDSQNV